ncbi:MAG: bifunctional UDP-N-acetylglucosamine diphosphorylase/glucosamine-1-phosphate N-acetyltransferase GlmU [Solirubrobacterales bacterium]|nr:bifunctional UDP-N-acetylglucosamine diphosphorylase/glucosamine-1-phosphate N-acetyltransferase GlmU [Solirubrobacterales bacterium]
MSEAVDRVAVAILAAGRGTRMRSPLAKVLHPVCGVPMVAWSISAAQAAGATRTVVVGSPDGALEAHLPEGVLHAVQPEADGTAGALAAAVEHLSGTDSVVVLAGDVPLIDAETIGRVLEAHAAAGAAATIATMVLDDPAGYGRIVRDEAGGFVKVVETKQPEDATADQLLLQEVNTGVVVFRVDGLGELLAGVGAANAQGERYLPDAVALLADRGETVIAVEVHDPALTIGVNDRADLARVQQIAQRRICDLHMRNGVTIESPDSVAIDASVEIGEDTTILLGSVLRGTTVVGAGSTIGPHSVLEDAEVGDGSEVTMSRLVLAKVGDGATVGPFAYLRPGADVGNGAKAGTFVELKNTTLGEGAKVPHLSYIGDADVGAGANLGASTITANYDGRNKHRTVVGARARTGVHTSLIAPVEVGEDALTGAGSAITDDIPDGALGITRPRQTNVEDFSTRDEDDA